MEWPTTYAKKEIHIKKVREINYFLLAFFVVGISVAIYGMIKERQ